MIPTNAIQSHYNTPTKSVFVVTKPVGVKTVLPIILSLETFCVNFFFPSFKGDMPLPCCSSKGDEEHSKRKVATPFHATLNLVNSVIGAGVLGIPFSFAKAGLVPAIIMFLLMTALNYVSLNCKCYLTILCYISDATLVYSYGDVCQFFLI